ncbi:MAG TPA: intradiol ring-cleavage dioxygenase [Noviherbaspirillum sp.]
MDTPEHDKPGGITRRDALLMLGATMLAPPAAAQFLPRRPTCVLTPEQTEGPYFSDLRLHRSDIRSDPTDGTVRPGVPLTLILHAYAAGGDKCTPIRGAVIDVWHCDARGVYSDAMDASFDTRGKKFLRGYQVTDEDGAVEFLTIYPGWYPGRAVHIHFKVRPPAASQREVEVTSQLYFPDLLTDAIHALAPYANSGKQRQRNEDDGLYRRGGRQLMLDVTRQGQGYAGNFDIGIAL